jgi:hypothetical protein
MQIADVAGRGEQGAQSAQRSVAEFIDDFCGTRVQRRPRIYGLQQGNFKWQPTG